MRQREEMELLSEQRMENMLRSVKRMNTIQRLQMASGAAAAGTSLGSDDMEISCLSTVKQRRVGTALTASKLQTTTQDTTGTGWGVHAAIEGGVDGHVDGQLEVRPGVDGHVDALANGQPGLVAPVAQRLDFCEDGDARDDGSACEATALRAEIGVLKNTIRQVTLQRDRAQHSLAQAERAAASCSHENRQLKQQLTDARNEVFGLTF